MATRLEPPRVNRIAVGLVGLGVIAAILYLVIRLATGGFSSGYTLTGQFTSAGEGLVPGSEVKIRGVVVGAVKSIKLAQDDLAQVTLHMNPGVHVPVTVSAAVNPVSLFGPKEIDLTPGADEANGPFLAAGGVIKATSSTVELGDILAQAYPVLKAIDPVQLGVVVDTIGQGLEGMGPELSSIVVNGRHVADVFAAQSPNISSLITNGNAIASTFADHSDAMLSALRNLNAITPDLVQRAPQFSALLDGAGKVAGDFAEVTNAESGPIRSGAAGTVELLNAAIASPPQFSQFVNALQTFFTILSGVINIRMPDGTWASRGHSVSATNLCENFPGLCSFLPVPVPNTPGGGPSPSPPTTLPPVPTTLPPVPGTAPPLTLPKVGGG